MNDETKKDEGKRTWDLDFDARLKKRKFGSL
jgi:hypothetical protein